MSFISLRFIFLLYFFKKVKHLGGAKMRRTFFLAVLVLILPTLVSAAPYYNFTIFGNHNVPVMKLINNSSNGEMITAFQITIGDTRYNFDAVWQENYNIAGFTRISPDTNSGGGVRSNVVSYTFTGFDSSEYFQFEADVDIDNSNTGEDYRTVMFNNGGYSNAQLTVTFSTGFVSTQVLPDYTLGSNGDTYSIAVVPEPASFALLGLALSVFIRFKK